MKSDTERKRYYNEKLHRRRNRMHVHLSKPLRASAKKRAILVRKGDTVRVMRGPGKGKEARVARVRTAARKVFLESLVVNNARGKEVPVAVEPSNLMLIALEPTPERKKVFSEEAFRKKEAPKKPKEDAAKPPLPAEVPMAVQAVEAPQADAKEKPAEEKR